MDEEEVQKVLGRKGRPRKGKAAIRTAVVRARIEESLKQDAETILHQLGFSTTEAIVVLFKLIKLHNGLPFDLKLPANKVATLISMDDLMD